MSEQTYWSGTVWGTNPGTVLIEFIREGENLSGRFTFLEPGVGQTFAQLSGTWDATGHIDATLDRFTVQSSVPLILPITGKISSDFKAAENIIEGIWSTDIGTNGKFVLVKVPVSSIPIPGQPLPGIVTAPNQPANAPAQNATALVTKTVQLGSYRFDADALRRLAEIVRSGTNITEPAINAAWKGREFIHIGVDNLLADPNVPDVVLDMIVAANEPVTNLGTRTVTVSLKSNDSNSLFVSGYERVWVEGKAAQIENFLLAHQTRAATWVRKYGPYVNSVLFLLLLAFLPSIPSIGNRLKVLGLVFTLLTFLVYSWKCAVPTKVFLRAPKISWNERYSPLLINLLCVALSGAIAYLIQKYVSAVGPSIKNG